MHKFKIYGLTTLMATFLLMVGCKSEKENVPITVENAPITINALVDSYKALQLMVKCEIKNISTKPVLVNTWGASLDKHWKTDSNMVVVHRYTPRMNFPMRFIIAPSKTWGQKVIVNVLNKPSDGILKFRMGYMGFTMDEDKELLKSSSTIVLKDTYWSNEITFKLDSDSKRQ